MNRPAPSHLDTDTERVLWESRQLAWDCIAAMQRKHDRWWRLWGVFWRKPWRASHRPRSLRDLRQWLRNAHDCQDPAVGCSCHPSYRFPAPAASA